MPYKFNQSRRDKIKKSRYKVTNWSQYNEALRQRADVTVWFSPEAIAAWNAEGGGTRGRPRLYSDEAIETALLVRQVFRLPLRQTEGFMRSVVRLLALPLSIPDFSSLSRRGIGLCSDLLAKAMQPGSKVIVDSSGLKVYGRDEWHQEKHQGTHRRIWRKLHLAVDEHPQLVACELTTTEVGDGSAVPDLLAQVPGEFDTFIGDGAYDGGTITHAVLARQPDAAIVVPPPRTAVPSADGNTQRDEHLRTIAQQGRMAWQQQTDYGLRNYAELAVQRFKRLFGNALKARELSRQKTEARIGASALNRFTQLGMPVSIKIA